MNILKKIDLQYSFLNYPQKVLISHKNYQTPKSTQKAFTILEECRNKSNRYFLPFDLFKNQLSDKYLMLDMYTYISKPLGLKLDSNGVIFNGLNMCKLTTQFLFDDTEVDYNDILDFNVFYLKSEYINNKKLPSVIIIVNLRDLEKTNIVFSVNEHK
ncbi:MAG: hypothetical protein ACOC22_01315 [bacterium]